MKSPFEGRLVMGDNEEHVVGVCMGIEVWVWVWIWVWKSLMVKDDGSEETG